MLTLEFIGSFASTFVGLLVGYYFFSRPCSALFYGFVSAMAVFIVMTPLFWLSGSQRPLLNPAVTVLNRAIGKLETPSVVTYIVAQIAGVFLAYVIFRLLITPSS